MTGNVEMAEPRALVLRAAGTNCDRETEYALRQAGFTAERVHVFRLMENPGALGEYQFLVIPGGFSYGDDVSAGKILANQIRHRLVDGLNEFVAAGKLVLGICNGFQVLLKSGLLPWGEACGGRPSEAGPSAQGPTGPGRDTTLAWNDSGRFEDRWVHLRCDSEKCVFLPKGRVIALPIAHGEGKFVCRDEGVLQALRDGDQVAVRYVDEKGDPGPYPINPNGSIDDIAGICDPSGRIFGLMPHPERFVDVTHHPQWTRSRPQHADGQGLFQLAFDYLK